MLNNLNYKGKVVKSHHLLFQSFHYVTTPQARYIFLRMSWQLIILYPMIEGCR